MKTCCIYALLFGAMMGRGMASVSFGVDVPTMLNSEIIISCHASDVHYQQPKNGTEPGIIIQVFTVCKGAPAKPLITFLSNEMLSLSIPSEFLYASCLLNPAPKEILTPLLSKLEAIPNVPDYRKLGILNIALRVEGIRAFNDVVLQKPTQITSPDKFSARFLLDLQGSIDYWMYQNISLENSKEMLLIAQTYPFVKLSRILSSMKHKLPISELPLVASLLATSTDLESRYECGRLIASMLPDEHIIVPIKEEFYKNPDRYVKEWEANVSAAIKPR